MKQLMETEQYIGLVRQLGIEEAYKQRHRATGRTTRQILELATRLSAGRRTQIVYRNKPGQKRDNAKSVLHAVRRVCETLGMQAEWFGDACYYQPSGGRIALIEDTPNAMASRVKEWELYELHD